MTSPRPIRHCSRAPIGELVVCHPRWSFGTSSRSRPGPTGPFDARRSRPCCAASPSASLTASGSSPGLPAAGCSVCTPRSAGDRPRALTARSSVASIRSKVAATAPISSGAPSDCASTCSWCWKTSPPGRALSRGPSASRCRSRRRSAGTRCARSQARATGSRRSGGRTAHLSPASGDGCVRRGRAAG